MFIAFEGLEGVGKSTQAHKFVPWLATRLPHEMQGVYTRAPGGTFVGEKLRSIFLSKEYPMSEATEDLIALANLVDIQDKIVSQCNSRFFAVCDRFDGSFFAYSYARWEGNIPSWIEHTANCLIHPPDISFYLKLHTTDGTARARNRNKGSPKLLAEDKYDNRDDKYYELVRKGFEQYWMIEPVHTDIFVIDAEGSEEEVHKRIVGAFRNWMLTNNRWERLS